MSEERLNDIERRINDLSRDKEPRQGSSGCLKLLGCGCLILLILGVGGCGAFAFGVVAMLRNSEPCQRGFALAAANPEVLAVTGQPLTMGWFITGSISDQGSSGSAELSIPVSGPSGSGHVLVTAELTPDNWQYRSITFKAADGRIIVLGDGATVEKITH